jgi:transcriptional regulator with XRE-family HTH domain
MSAGVSQGHVAHVAGLSQTMVSRIERSQRTRLTIGEAAVMCAALGLRLHLKAYPEGLPVRDAAQLKLLARFRRQVSGTFGWRTEVPVGEQGDLRAWDVVLGASVGIGVDAETRLHDMQALQRRLELKLRDSAVGRVVLVISGTHHNRDVLRAHRSALMSTLPLDTAAVMRSLRAGDVPPHNGIVVL